MTGRMNIISAGPGVTVQDLGRPGHLATGLSRGGAADRLALFEAAALLGQNDVVAGIEMAGMGGKFTFSAPTRIALTGAPMHATLEDTPILWNASHLILPGQVLSIGGAKKGVFGYLTPAGGIKAQSILGSHSTHLAVGIGAPLVAGGSLTVGDDPALNLATSLLQVRDRFSGGSVRLMPGPQTDLFDPNVLADFLNTTFTRSPTGNRQGVRLDHDGAPFAAMISGQASDLIMPGDIQMTGDGVPYVLLSECQTTGGYPRIGSVIQPDLPLIAQAPPGVKVNFTMVTLEEADAAYRPEAGLISGLKKSVQLLVRAPHDIQDLLSYQLISGVTAGDED